MSSICWELWYYQAVGVQGLGASEATASCTATELSVRRELTPAAAAMSNHRHCDGQYVNKFDNHDSNFNLRP